MTYTKRALALLMALAVLTGPAAAAAEELPEGSSPVYTEEPAMTTVPAPVGQASDPSEETPSETPAAPAVTEAAAVVSRCEEEPEAEEPIDRSGAMSGVGYIINGVQVSDTDFRSSPGQCWAYANAIYEEIWGERFDMRDDSEDNFLRLLDDDALTLTAAHLKAYVSAAALGSCLRVCGPSCLHGTDSQGHSQIIVQKDEDGFTVFQGGMYDGSCREARYYTWQEYIDTGWLGGRYSYIKYIKWPGAEPYVPCVVTFDANGGECGVSSVTVRACSAPGELPEAVRPGWIFTGWYSAPVGGRRFTAESTAAADMTVYAQWEWEHAWGAWTETQAPTYSQPGLEYRECLHCPASQTREIPPLTGTPMDAACLLQDAVGIREAPSFDSGPAPTPEIQ